MDKLYRTMTITVILCINICTPALMAKENYKDKLNILPHHDWTQATLNKDATFYYTTNEAPNNLPTSTTTNWLFSLRPRLSLPVRNTLFYLTGGLAVEQAKFKQSFSEFSFIPTPENASFTKIRSGWTIGAGIEYAFSERWSLKGEYLFSRFSKENISARLNNVNGAIPAPGFIDGATFNNSLSQHDVHMLGAGINYHFA